MAPPKKDRSALRQKNYDLILASVIVGARAPQSKPFGPLDSTETSALAKAGCIKIEIYAHNWRVITIMEGPHKGKHTQLPDPRGRPYKVVYLDHVIPRRAAP